MNSFRTKSLLKKSLGVAVVYGLITIAGVSGRAFAADILVDDGFDDFITNTYGIGIDESGLDLNNSPIYDSSDSDSNGSLILNGAHAQLTSSTGHGFIVDGNTSTFSGGTNSSTWTLTDGLATLGVAGVTSGSERILISATTSATTTSPEVRIGATDSGNLTVNDNGVTLDNHGSPARLRGVADGVNDYDGVNVHQLNRLTRNAYSGIAQIAAMTAIPAPAQGHRYAFGVGVGTYGGEQAIAVGAKATVTDNLMVAGSLGAGFSSRTPVAGAVGASLSW